MKLDPKAVDRGLSESVVDIALAVRASPVVVRETAPVFVCEEFDAAREHIGLLCGIGRARELARGDALGERRLFKNIELIAIDAVELEGRRRREIVFPDGRRLPREAVNKVDHKRSLVVAADRFESTNHGIGVVDAQHRAPDFGAESLNAEREAVYAARDRRFNARVVKVVNAAFERNFAVVRERQVLLHSLEHAAKIFGRKRRGRAAAEVDGVNGARSLRKFP